MTPEDADRRCCLLLAGNPDASSGIYRPLGYSLVLVGDDVLQHQVTHLHEIHHKVLNDDTEYGALVHIAARHPVWSGTLLADLTTACRVVHETFAGFMSLSLAGIRHPDVDRVLDAYPVYRPLTDRMTRLLRPVAPGHRQDLAATGIARWCMSAPVLGLAAERYPDDLSLADIPADWRPDHRFQVLVRLADDTIRTACLSADSAFERGHGRSVEDLEFDETDSVLDAAWKEWEETFVRVVLAATPRLARMPTTPIDGHLEAAEVMVRALARDGFEVDLPRQQDDEPLSDIDSVGRLTLSASIDLRTPYATAVAELGDGVDLDEVLALCAASSTPFVVVHGRRPASLRRQFDFGEEKLRLAEDHPQFSIRVLLDDEGRDLILQAALPSPESFADVTAAWGDRGVAAVCVTASCYLEAGWQSRWLPALSCWPLVVLLDVGLPGLVGPSGLLGDGQQVYGAYLGLAHPSLRALICHVEGHPHVMLAIGDDLLVQLLAGQLSDLLGPRLSMSDADWSSWTGVLSAVSASVIGTEAAIVYDGAVAR